MNNSWFTVKYQNFTTAHINDLKKDTTVDYKLWRTRRTHLIFSSYFIVFPKYNIELPKIKNAFIGPLTYVFEYIFDTYI